MPTIVEDLRAIAANPASKTKAEVVEILLAAADRIESKRIELARANNDSKDAKRGS
ncbi:hypothetical protein IG197_01710 [Aminobacter sp. SR38]|jgi:light-regulated signal transduction histidine kinase (bacteriophytochrome)|uniref:hypothetical protein n=1 Tax=Aminobacter sp. SR38 TaxID=2774562 RepID=UPI0017845169|nr:hypothetical protein [Aminobacter sp. SR38]QOF71833.1 hypothetical protein IG197_01710 [Aminobacter sp. SR38]